MNVMDRSFVFNHPFNFIAQNLDRNNQLDISKLSYEDFQEESLRWYISSTIEDTVIGLIEQLEVSELLPHRLLKESGKILKNLNDRFTPEDKKQHGNVEQNNNDSNSEANKINEYIGHQFFLLCIYKYSGYAPAIIVLLYYYLFYLKDKMGAAVIVLKFLEELRDILHMNTYEDEVLANYEIEYLLHNFRFSEGYKSLELKYKLKLQRAFIRNRIITAARIFGDLYLHQMITEDNFKFVFYQLLDDSPYHPYKFEAVCHFLLVSGAFVSGHITIQGTKYFTQLPADQSIDSINGIRFLNLTVLFLKKILLKHYHGTQRKLLFSTFLDLCIELQARNDKNNVKKKPVEIVEIKQTRALKERNAIANLEKLEKFPNTDVKDVPKQDELSQPPVGEGKQRFTIRFR